MTDLYPWIPSRKPSHTPLLDEYPKRIDLKQVNILEGWRFRSALPLLGVAPLLSGGLALATFAGWEAGENSGAFPVFFAIVFIAALLVLAIAPVLLKPKSIKDAISDGMIPSRTNKNIHDTYERLTQIPGWEVVAAQDWAEMCDLADEAAAARSNDLTGPRELKAYNDAIRDYAAHIEHKVAHVREIEKGAYTQEIDQQRADVIRNRALQLEQDND